MILPSFLLFSIISWSSAESDGRTPFCSICVCLNQTQTNPDINCSEKIISYALYNSSYWQSDINTNYQMRSLDLSNINLRDLNDTFPSSTLIKLDLSHNGIRNIANEVFKNLQDMSVLILSYNDIQIINPSAFKGLRIDGYDYPLQSLKELWLDHNNIHTLNEDVFQHIERELEILSLSYNPLKVLDQTTVIAITGIVQLQELYLSHTQLKEIPNYFLHTPKYLKKFDLSGNRFTSVPNTLSDSHALEEFVFSDNPITILNEETGFPELLTLKILHMCYMPNLTEIGAKSLSGLKHLEELYLSNNMKLSKIHSQALMWDEEENKIWPPIKKLTVDNNKLSYLNSTIIVRWDVLQTLDIRNNLWTCECENQWMVDELMPVYISLNETEAKEVKCGAPIEMEGQTLYDIHKKKSIMRCLDIYGNRPERDGAILVGVFIGVLLGIPLVLFILYSHKRNWYGLFDNSPAAYSRTFYQPSSLRDETI